MGNNQNNEKMKFWSIVLLTINGIIGTGIFLSPGAVAKLVGDKAAMIYLAAAAFAAVLAVSFAAASKYVVKSGAAYAYSKAAFGDEVGSYVGITRVVSASIAWGVLATGVVKTALSIFGKDSSDMKTVTIGFITLMVVLLIINLIGTKLLTIISNISTIGKIGALGITIIAGIFILVFSDGANLQDLTILKDADGKNIIPEFTTSVFVTALVGAFYAFTGFESVASGSADMEEPEKNLPRAIPLAIVIIACIYFGIIPLAFNYNMAGIIIISSISRFIQFIIVPLAVITFYFGKSKEDILNANKNVITDVIIPIIGLFLTILLLVKFNWAQQFSTKLDDGTTTLNIKAVVSMVIGYVILPICLRIYMRGKK